MSFDNTPPEAIVIAPSVVPVRAAAITNVVIASTGNGASLGGVTLATGNIVLLTGQSAGAENGVYTVGAGSLTRAADMNTAAEVAARKVVGVSAGTYAGRRFNLTTSGAITLDTTALTYALLDPVAQTLGTIPTQAAAIAIDTHVDDVNDLFGATVQGVPMIEDTIVLLINQDLADVRLNGLYEIHDGATVRPAGYNQAAEFANGLKVTITGGTFSGQRFYLQTPPPIVVDTTPLYFTAQPIAIL